MLRVRKRVAQIVGVLTRELFQTAPRLVPALRRRGERLVILELKFGRRGLAVDRPPIFLNRRCALSTLRKPPRIVHALIVR